ncbi:Autotransporter domain-containing protein [Bordetella tumbae]|uniref:autotransporter family protein n=1 Tax=Bordetella tumbae TaxID=1649139 RepID=UPI0039F09C14
MITIFNLNGSRRFRDWAIVPALRKQWAQQSTRLTSYVLLASLLIPSSAQSAFGPYVGHGAPEQASRANRFSRLRTEEQTVNERLNSTRRVLFGSQTVVVDVDMKTQDGYAFSDVHVIGDRQSKLIIWGGDAAQPVLMYASDFEGQVIITRNALQMDGHSIAAKQIFVKNGAQLITNTLAAPDYEPGRARDQRILVERGASLQVGTLSETSENQIKSFAVKGNLTNRGDVWIHNLSSGAGSTLYVQGDYHGEKNSAVHMAIHSRSDPSPWFVPGTKIVHDKLVIMGNSSGESQVNVVNLGGGGAAMDYARGSIKLITVAGNSEAEFIMKQRAVAGTYEYRLVRGDSSYPDTDASKNWYLVSDASSAGENGKQSTEAEDDLSPAEDGSSQTADGRPVGIPIGQQHRVARTPPVVFNNPSNAPLQIAPPPENVDQTPSLDDTQSEKGTLPEDETDVAANAGDLSRSNDDTSREETFSEDVLFAPRIKIIRPEAGSYNSNALAANTMFQMNLNDRLSSYYQGEGHGHRGSAWVRYNGARDHFNDASGQLRIRGDKNIVMLGIDMLASSTDLLDQFTIGLMGGYGHYRGHTASRVSGYSSHGRVDGHSVGIYGTYQQNADTQSGIYLDSWVLWNRFNNKVKGDDLPNERYTSKGVTASAELGYNAKIAEHNNVKYVLQPHAQIIYQNVRSDSLREENGTRVEFLNRGRTQTVLGVRAAAHVPSGLTSTITPHLELNWLHSSKNYALRMNGVGAEMNGGRNTGQLKLGVEGDINQRVALDVALFRNQGKSGYHETGGNLALKYRY